MARRIFNKRVIATLLTLVMLFNGFQISASAAQNDTVDLVQNFEDTYYKQDGAAGTASDWEIHLSKTAAPTAKDNVYDITLKIETKDTFTQIAGSTDGAAVLVLDVSSSMDKDTGTCSNCGKAKYHSDHSGRRPTCKFEGVTHLQLLKEAVKSFLDSYVEDAAAGDKRMVAIVKFATNADTVLSWIDVNNAANLTSVKNAVDAMDSKTGTNIEAGMVLGRNLLTLSDVKSIPLTNQSLILFSDGSPTVAVGNVNDTSITHVASDGRGVAAGSRTSDDLDDILADINIKKKAVAYNTDSALLESLFGSDNVITSNVDSLVMDLATEAGGIVTSKTNASTVTDPMGTGVSMITVTTNYSEDTQRWDLSKFTPAVANGITTYTITYQVEIDPMAVELDDRYPGYTVLTPANGETTLNYTYGEQATSVNAGFNEPNIRGIRTFTVSYNYAGEVPAGAPKVPADATYKAGQFVKIAAAPTLKNYTFSGWDKSDFVMPAADVVITGFWTENAKYDYILTYDANFGGNQTKADSENKTGIYETVLNMSVDANTFVRPNYTFIGWNTQPDGSGKAYAVGETVHLTAQNNTEVLYAQWIEHPKYAYSVIYNANFGSNETKADSENVVDTYATVMNIGVDANTFVRPNHTFIGWNTQPDGTGIAYEAGNIVALTAENNTVILYAQWQENPKYDYSVVYDANFGGNMTKADAENISGIYATQHNITVDRNTFIRANYTFTGWNTRRDGTGAAFAADDIIALTAENNTAVLYAQWQENPKYDYSVVYDANFGGNETKADGENVTGIYATSVSIRVDANTFVRENFTFIGWNTERNGSGKAYAAGEMIHLTAGNNTKVLYAQWIENDKFDYSVIYNANFGDNETKADAENLTGTYAKEHDIRVDKNTFVRPNHTFIGWATSPDGEVVYQPGDNIHFVEGGEEVLYAKWEEHPKYNYSVIYNGNGGALTHGGLAYGDSENVPNTYATSLNIGVDANTFLRDNYTFTGWNTAADGTGTAYTAEDVIALTAEDNTLTLYAQWIENPKYDYSVIYDANFGGNETKADSENITGIYATALNMGVDANGFARRGYTFVGWNTERDGSGEAYGFGDVIALTAEVNTATLYAQWQINEYDYTVNYWVRINGEAYTLFAGDLSGAPAGEKAAFGAVIDKAYLDAKGLPATLTDGELTYEFNAFEGITVSEEGNVVNVYFTCIVEEPPVEEPPVEEPPVEEPPVEEPPVEEPPVEEPPVTEPEVEIPEEDVPMADIPKTGDPIFVYIGSAAASAAGLIGLLLKKKEEKED